MRVALGIPFWGDDPVRQRLFERAAAVLKDIYHWEDIHICYDVPNRGGARNELVRWSADADVIVLCDADTYPEAETLEQAIETAYTDGGLHFAYDQWQLVRDNGSLHASGPGSLGGCMAIRPSDWFAAGGSPELVGWGFEDVMFAVQARTFLKPNTWHTGMLTCLYHPTECAVGSPQYDINIAECKKVEALDQKPEELRAHIEASPYWR